MAGLPVDTLRFLAQLKKHNNRSWFEANRHRYERIRNEALAFTTALLQRIRQFDPSVAHTPAEACLFRIYRDLRFTKDKSPFKTHIGIAISAHGKNFAGAGYYLHLEPGNCFAAGGCWMPDSRQLYLIRQEIDYNYPAFLKIIQAPAFRRYFQGLDEDLKLTRPPRGYAADHPAIEWLKLKSFTCSTPIPQHVIATPQLLSRLERIFKAMNPFIQFLNTALSDAESDKISFF
ncbi:MAG: DUF2461 domain-containing protein [Chitinophagales bacterium]|nr:DUF2461 domain-containing protein [Chitinophagales bacterium]MDW8427691.1 DUF2461 domain-containing protein [Chitinophagales bacterium]